MVQMVSLHHIPNDPRPVLITATTTFEDKSTTVANENTAFTVIEEDEDIDKSNKYEVDTEIFVKIRVVRKKLYTAYVGGTLLCH